MAGTMNDQKKSEAWHAGKDDVGRPVLVWDNESHDDTETTRDKHDPLAPTRDILKRLSVTNLALQSDADDGSRDPYDSDG